MTDLREEAIAAMARAMFEASPDRDQKWDDERSSHLRAIYRQRAGNALDALLAVLEKHGAKVLGREALRVVFDLADWNPDRVTCLLRQGEGEGG
jgi:hypothetical protein